MTRVDLCRGLGKEKEHVASTISRMCRTQKTVPQRLYVSGYVFDSEVEGDRRYPRALYSLGAKPNAKKPKPDDAANALRYRERNKLQCSSIFNLGLKGRYRRSLAPTTQGSKP